MYPILARYPNHEALSCIRLTEMGIVCRSSPLCTARVDPEVATCRGPSDARKDSLPCFVANISAENLFFWRVSRSICVDYLTPPGRTIR
jgi:hypothetical protein